MSLQSQSLKKECKKTEQNIPDFLEGKLSLENARLFFEHIDHCKGCREELEISFLLTEGAKRAERGETIDLKADLDKLIQHERQRLIRRDRMRIVLQASGVALIFGAIIAVLIVFF